MDNHLARVVIVDRHRLFADAVRTLLADEGFDVRVSATAAEGMAAVRSDPPQLVLIDAHLPDADPIATGRRMLDHCPTAKVVAMVTTGDSALLRRAARAGFVGVVTKAPPLSRFIRAIREVTRGRRLETRASVRDRAGAASRPAGDPSSLARYLTKRERQVLALLAMGESTMAIAARLTITRNTARSHVQNVLTKLQVRSRLEAATVAVRHGLVPPDGGHHSESNGESSSLPPVGRGVPAGS